MAEIKEFKNRMIKTAEVLSTQFDTVRAGRANAAVLDQIEVDYYGSPTPIRQIASISSPDPRTLLIQPWDGSTLKLIEKAILTSELGINPQNDGRVIRLVFPQLTEERRKELAKHLYTVVRGKNGRHSDKAWLTGCRLVAENISSAPWILHNRGRSQTKPYN